MKLNLLYGSDDVQKDYINVDPLGFEHPDKTWVNLDSLDKVCYDGQADEVRALNVLSMYEQSNCATILQHWVGKVRLGGKFVFGEININHAARDLIRGKLSQAQFTDLLYGVTHHKKNCISIDDIIAFLEQSNFRIIKKHYAGHFYVVEGIREG